MSTIDFFIGTVLIIAITSVCWTMVGRPKFFKLFSIAKYKHVQKEKKLLADIIKDIKKNPGHWVKNGYCPVTFQSPMLVNDYSNIGIRYGEQHTETPNTVLIHFNMKNVTKFDQNDDSSIATRIDGKHAKKFINTLTTILDVRGKELDFFREQLKERL